MGEIPLAAPVMGKGGIPLAAPMTGKGEEMMVVVVEVGGGFLRGLGRGTG